MGAIDFSRFDVLTFDCYGTLIDWEAGDPRGLRRVLGALGVDAGDDDLLERYARAEAAWRPAATCATARCSPRCAASARSWAWSPRAEAAAFGGSVGDWPAFPDSAEALARLHDRFRLAVITNCDDDLFAASNGGWA